MRKRFSVMLVGAVLASMAGPASAQHTCEYPFAVYSGPGIDANVARCGLDSSDDLPDGRVILPGTTSISVSYLEDAGVPELTAVLNGFGFTNKSVKLKRGTRDTAGVTLVTYDSASIPLPGGRLSSGCLTVAITFQAGTQSYVEDTAYHSVDSSC